MATNDQSFYLFQPEDVLVNWDNEFPLPRPHDPNENDEVPLEPIPHTWEAMLREISQATRSR